MKKYLILLFCILTFNIYSQNYKPFTKQKCISYSIIALGGTIDGLVEGYEFDNRKSFERKFNVKSDGFWGSESWRKIYINGNPELGTKSKLHNWVGAFDFYHIGDDTRKASYIVGGIGLGISGKKVNTKKWHYVADYAIGFAISGLFKSISMHWIRN